MKVHGKKGKNILLEVTPYELEAIRTALFEWQGVEDLTSIPQKEFEIVLKRIHKAQNKFDSLPIYRSRQIGNTTQLTIDHNQTLEDVNSDDQDEKEPE